MSRKPFLFIAVPFLVLLVVFTGLYIAIEMSEPWAKKQIENAVHDACASCKLSIGDIQLSLFTIGGIEFKDIKFSSGKKGGQEIQASVRKIVVRHEVISLLRRQIRVGYLGIVDPKVTFTDGEARAKAVSGNVEMPAFDEFAIYDTRISGGEFTYVRNVKNTNAALRIKDLHIDAGPLGNVPELKDETANFKTTSQIEGSGRVALDISVKVFSKPLFIDTVLDVKDQDLEGLSRFFKPNAGVDLKGLLVNGQATTKLRGNHLNATVRARYKDFSLRLDKMYDRSEIQAFFTNLGAALAMQDKNTDESKSEQTRAVELDRQPNESIVSFILRGLKEASLEIVTPL